MKHLSLKTPKILTNLAAAMFTTLIALAHAQASDFACTSVDQDTRIDVSIESDAAAQGHRAITMSIFDLNVSEPRQLIAKFVAADGLLNINNNGVIIADVDLTNPNSSRRGERIGGTVLGALKSIVLDIDFSYQEAFKKGTGLSATVTYVKRNGEELVQDFDCIAN
jgi:hypothetical protein